MTEEEHVEDVQEAEEAPERVELEPEAPEQPEAPQWSNEDVEEAKLFGWKAPEEWQGEKPEGYIDNPEEYLARVQRSRIFKTMQGKIEKAETAAQEQARKLDSMNRTALERQRENYESEIARITQGQRKAVEEGDTDAFDALEKERGNLKPVEVPPQEDIGSQKRAEVAEYANSEAGQWLKDPVLARAGAQIIQQTPGAIYMSGQEQAEFARTQLQQIYPDRFPQEKKPAPVRQTVDPGGMAPASMQKRSAYDKLPSDAKTAFKRYVGEGLYADTKEGREEFANDYDAA